jgi:hypothetical protein
MSEEVEELYFAPPEIIKPEFRLYYNEMGQVLFYTGDKPDDKGDNFVVITPMVFAEARPDLRVHRETKELIWPSTTAVSRLVESETGTRCHALDISVICPTGEKTWKLKVFKL